MNELQRKVKRCLELERQMYGLNIIKKSCDKYGLVELINDIDKLRAEKSKEYQLIMDDPYICDKVNGLKTGGII